MRGTAAMCVMCSTIVACRDRHRCARIESWPPCAHVLELAHPRPGHHAAPGRLAGVLRGPRPVSLREAAPPARGSWTSTGYAGERVLDVGCGAGMDLVRFARGGAIVTGVDVVRRPPFALARRTSRSRASPRTCATPTASTCRSRDASFDFVFAHGVVQYTADDRALVDECRRVLQAGRAGRSSRSYNRISWLNALSKLMKVAARARGRAGAQEVQPRRVPRAARGVPRRAPRRGALSGEVAAARRLEGRALQRRSSSARSTRCRARWSGGSAGTCSRSAAVKPTHAPDQSPRVRQRLPLRRARRDVAGADRRGRRATLCDRHRGIGADGLILYDRTPEGARCG